MFAPRLGLLFFVASILKFESFSAASNEMNATGLTDSLTTALNETRHAASKVHQTTSISNRDNDATLAKHVSWRGRRLKRDTVSDVVAALNVFGIIVSAFNPFVGAGPLILAALLPVIFPGGGDPTTAFRDLIWEERAQQQRVKLFGFRDTMMQIVAQGRHGNVGISNHRMLSLYDSLNSDRCLFMRTDNIRSSYTYFKEFATMHIVVNQAMILIHPNDFHWENVLHKNVREYVKYARFVIWKEVESRRMAIVEAMTPSIDAFRKQLPSYMQETLWYYGYVPQGVAVSFKVITHFGGNHWLSCWGSGSQCTGRGCPGEDNPMERGSQYQYYWHCRGEVFWIEGIDKNDKVLRSCSRIGIKYSENDNQHWWLSHANGEPVRTRTCPGQSASSIRHDCGGEEWRIYVPGKPCGVPVQDHDVVRLNDPSGKAALREYNWNSDPSFIIFRSDVERRDYYRDLPCV